MLLPPTGVNSLASVGNTASAEQTEERPLYSRVAAGCTYELVTTNNDHAEVDQLLSNLDGSEFELRTRRPSSGALLCISPTVRFGTIPSVVTSFSVRFRKVAECVITYASDATYRSAGLPNVRLLHREGSWSRLACSVRCDVESCCCL